MSEKKITSSQDIRNSFTEFFAAKGHTVVPSSPLIPANDNTLLFTNAGMVQFKDVFLGREQRDYSRAVSVQRCVRAGGKHNDLENVGYTARHHTFFEMLGNFSFGDYFKREAIAYAWEYLTKVLQLPEEKLWVTVHESDKEAEAIWLKEIGVSPERFSRMGDKDNFWQMGDTGPCGPCSEIFYDHGPEVAGGPPGSPDEDGDRYIEIWNLVFMQYERDEFGKLHPLPNPSIDTGMGLERIAAVLQGVHSNYEIDTFKLLIRAAQRETGCQDIENRSLRVIADHIRSCAFLVLDGVTPSNEGRGYVLRRIIRRAVRHGFMLGAPDGFFHRLLPDLIEAMGEAYPELGQHQARIAQVLAREEHQFSRTIEQGMGLLEEAIKKLQGTVIPGELAFQLYDTYGFPFDLTEDIAREKGLQVDRAGFDAEMAKQRARSKSHQKFSRGYEQSIQPSVTTEFVGYEVLETQATVGEIFVGNEKVDEVSQGMEAVIVLDKTPFYAESGGQVGDKGVLRAEHGTFRVTDTQKQGAAWLHYGTVLKGRIGCGEKVVAAVESESRWATARHHSATHLLHAALRQVLGEHVMQKGSLVEAERLRFDFSHPEALTQAQIFEIEALVNAQIMANHEVKTEIMAPDEAKKAGAMALFGEKYGDQVRVLTMGDFSKELCGGTHVTRTGDIGLFRITSESGIASGIRRIEAVAGDKAIQWTQSRDALLMATANLVKSSPAELPERIQQMQSQLRSLQKKLEKAKAEALLAAGAQEAPQQIGDLKLVVRHTQGLEMKALRESMDQLRSRVQDGICILTTKNSDKAQFIIGLTGRAKAQLNAGELVKALAQLTDGKGGGRPDLAQGGTGKPDSLEEAVEKLIEQIRKNICG
ncbi:MAG: alanine--tRNA ligase [Gammaproteobacteria bacterium]|nr:MAG: alanine--tRNA ligase [Gammaproteobacteria bacterium]